MAASLKTVPHTLRELALRAIDQLKLASMKPEDQPYAASVLEEYTKRLMTDRVYAKSDRLAPKLGQEAPAHVEVVAQPNG